MPGDETRYVAPGTRYTLPELRDQLQRQVSYWESHVHEMGPKIVAFYQARLDEINQRLEEEV